MEVRVTQAEWELDYHLQLQMECEQGEEESYDEEWDLQELLGDEASCQLPPLDFDAQLEAARDQGCQECRDSQGAALEQAKLELQQARDSLLEEQARQRREMALAADQERQALFRELQQDHARLQEERDRQKRDLELGNELSCQELIQERQSLLQLKEQQDMEAAASHQVDATRMVQLDQIHQEREALQHECEDLLRRQQALQDIEKRERATAAQLQWDLAAQADDLRFESQRIEAERTRLQEAALQVDRAQAAPPGLAQPAPIPQQGPCAPAAQPLGRHTQMAQPPALPVPGAGRGFPQPKIPLISMGILLNYPISFFN
uniref:Uncharacterized protein n=1 Tax=Sphaerodactylus townsendi TaxID=933632 RepID=A0ACB8E6W3_9SAUR